MELSQEFLIDMAINALGYLFAGVISVLLYAMLQKKKSTVELDEIVEDSAMYEQAAAEKKANIETTSNRKVEFITFGNNHQESIEKQPVIKNDISQGQNNGRMNRKEVINLAKKMLLAGASNEKIKKILPVSESELALLNLNNK